jgi:hypothetical protein
VNEALEFSVESSSLYLPDNHKIYEKYKRSVAKVRIQWLLMEIKQLTLCNGIRDSDLVKSIKSNATLKRVFYFLWIMAQPIGMWKILPASEVVIVKFC